MIYLRWTAFTAGIVSVGYLLAYFSGKETVPGAFIGLLAASVIILVTEG